MAALRNAYLTVSSLKWHGHLSSVVMVWSGAHLPSLSLSGGDTAFSSGGSSRAYYKCISIPGVSVCHPPRITSFWRAGEVQGDPVPKHRTLYYTAMAVVSVHCAHVTVSIGRVGNRCKEAFAYEHLG